MRKTVPNCKMTAATGYCAKEMIRRLSCYSRLVYEGDGREGDREPKRKKGGEKRMWQRHQSFGRGLPPPY
jgi:hypothetical protein